MDMAGKWINGNILLDLGRDNGWEYGLRWKPFFSSALGHTLIENPYNKTDKTELLDGMRFPSYRLAESQHNTLRYFFLLSH